MIAVLYSFVPAPNLPITLRVSHHVVLPESLIRCYQVKRDGSLVGSIGYEGLHDGRCTPLIAQKGRIVKIKNLNELSEVEVLESRTGGEFIIEKFNELHRASLIFGTLNILEKIPRKPMIDDHSWRKMAPDKGMWALFRLPRGWRTPRASNRCIGRNLCLDAPFASSIVSTACCRDTGLRSSFLLEKLFLLRIAYRVWMDTLHAASTRSTRTDEL